MAGAALPIRLLAGAAAGHAGTFVLQGLLAGSRRWAPQTFPPMRQGPAEFMVEQPGPGLPPARRGQGPPQGKAAAEKGLHVAGPGEAVATRLGLGITTAAACQWLARRPGR